MNTNYIWLWWDCKILVLILYFDNVRHAVYHVDRELSWSDWIAACRMWGSHFDLHTQRKNGIAYYF